MSRVVVVGKNSFMARSLRENEIGVDWCWMSHHEALKDEHWLANTDCVINFSYAPELRRNEYDSSLDIDTKLANKIKNHPIQYVMLSSRMVYGEQEQPELTEIMAPTPQNQYGRNKYQIEKNLVDVLGKDRVCILRLSNIFGFEPERSSFFGMALTKLKNENQITYDMSPFTRRDFMSVWSFGKALECVVKKPVGGVFNLGSGIGLETGWIAQWLIEGYESGSLHIKDMSVRDVFWMNIDKIKEEFDIPAYDRENLKQDCILCGEKMRKTQNA